MGNLQGDPSSHCFGKRPRRQSTDLSSSRHLRAKCRLITTSSAHPPRASPGDHVFEAPKYLLLLCFRGFPSPHHGWCKSPTQSHPRWRRRRASAQPPCARALRQTDRQPPDGQSAQKPAGPSWLFTALGSLTAWLRSQQPCPELPLKPKRSPDAVWCPACPRASLQPRLLLGINAPKISPKQP